MSNPPGIDLDHLFSRLHTGMRGLQSWRDHRRARFADVAPAGAAAPTVVAAASSPTAPSPHGMGSGHIEPQGFVDIGGRLFPVFGDLQVHPSPPATPTTTEPPAPTTTPPSPSTPPASTAEPPRPTRLNAAVLKMPLPTPPACLSRATAPPAEDGEPAPAPPAEPTQASPDVPMDPTTLVALLQRRSDAEAMRLEQIHAEHRALLAALLSEHRAQLADQSEAAARREHKLFRDLLTEHGAQLQAHAESMRHLLTQHREDVKTIVAAADQAPEGHARSITGISELLAEQAKLQAQAHEQAEQHIGDLAAVLGELGQTVGQLAAATFERKRDPAPALLLPPQLGISGPVPVMPWPPSSPTPTAGAADPTAPPQPVPAPSPALTADLAPPAPMASPDAAPTSSVPPARLKPHDASRAQTRVAAFVDEFDDDDDLQDVDDPDDPPPRARLSPITPLDRIEASEPPHG